MSAVAAAAKELAAPTKLPTWMIVIGDSSNMGFRSRGPEGFDMYVHYFCSKTDARAALRILAPGLHPTLTKFTSVHTVLPFVWLVQASADGVFEVKFNPEEDCSEWIEAPVEAKPRIPTMFAGEWRSKTHFVTSQEAISGEGAFYTVQIHPTKDAAFKHAATLLKMDVVEADDFNEAGQCEDVFVLGCDSCPAIACSLM